MRNNQTRQVLAFFVVFTMCCVQLGIAQKNQSYSVVSGQIVGKLESKQKGKHNVPVIQVDGVDWKLEFDPKQISAETWKKLVGKKVLAVGKLKLSKSQVESGDENSNKKKIKTVISHNLRVEAITLITKRGFEHEERYEKAEKLLVKLEDAIKKYMATVGQAPKKLEDLAKRPKDVEKAKWKGPYVKEGEEFTIDPWGLCLYLKIKNGKKIVVTTSGPDGQLGTADDFSNTDLKKKNK